VGTAAVGPESAGLPARFAGQVVFAAVLIDLQDLGYDAVATRLLWIIAIEAIEAGGVEEDEGVAQSVNLAPIRATAFALAVREGVFVDVALVHAPHTSSTARRAMALGAFRRGGNLLLLLLLLLLRFALVLLRGALLLLAVVGVRPVIGRRFIVAFELGEERG